MVPDKWMREYTKQTGTSEKGSKKGPAQAAVVLMILIGLIIQNGCMSAKPADQDSSRRLTPAETAGIEIVRIHPSVGGQMLDLRYRVVDVEKAKLAFNRKAQIYLLDQASGMKLPVPDMAMVGKLLQRPENKDAKVYWIFFGNPGGLVRTGAKVTLVIDEIRITDIVVE